MKKITKILCASCLVLGATVGCGKEEPGKEEKVVTFAEYLNSQETLTASKLDEMVGAIDLNINDYTTTLDIPTSKVTVRTTSSTESVDSEAYIWKDTINQDDYVYIALLDENSQMEVGYKVNLTEIDSTINSYKNNVTENDDFEYLFVDNNDSGKLEISELLDNYFETLGNFDTTIFNVNTILSKVKFKIDDFDAKSSNVYELKPSALANLLKNIVGEEQDVPVENDVLGDVVKIQVTYDKNVVQEVKMVLNISSSSSESYDVEIEEGGLVDEMAPLYPLSNATYTVKLNFEYDNDNKVNKTTVDLVAETPETVEEDLVSSASYEHVVVTFGKDAFSFTMVGGTSALDCTGSLKFSVATVNAKTTVKFAFDSEFFKMDVEIGIVANWLSDAKIELVENTDDGKVTSSYEIESSVNVTVPSTIKNSNDFEDITDELISAIISSIVE